MEYQVQLQLLNNSANTEIVTLKTKDQPIRGTLFTAYNPDNKESFASLH